MAPVGASTAPATLAAQAGTTPTAETASASAASASGAARVAAADVSPFRPRLAGTSIDAYPIDLSEAPVGAKTSATASRGPGVPLQIGFVRELDRTADAARASDLLRWRARPDGSKVAALRFTSPHAKGLRLGVLVKRLPLEARLRFYPDDRATTAFEISAQQVMATIQRNLDAGDLSDGARMFWSPDLGAERVTMEVELPPGVDPATLSMAVPRLSHVFADLADPKAEQQGTDGLAKAGFCDVKNVSCRSDFNDDAKSVARMTFVKSDGASYMCTGTLLADKGATGVPYFLSAAHCIDDQTAASSMTTDWFYRTSSCNSSALAPEVKHLYGGATLLYASTDTDTSFMQLAETPPVGVVYAAWSSTPPPNAAPVVGLHHPLGEPLEYSEGVIRTFLGCTLNATTGLYSCTDEPSEKGSNFISTRWATGSPLQGSSGSGLFVTSGGKQLLVGQLFGADSICDIGTSTYGRFDLAYRAALSKWLDAKKPRKPRIPVYRFYNTKTSTHFYTPSAVERDRVLASLPEYTYDGIGFYAHDGDAGEGNAVYRFYNNKTAAHFYTMSAEEKTNVLANYAWYTDEGASWFAELSATPESAPMFRFYNTKTATHFYTISPGERDTVQHDYPDYSYEGIAYRAWTTP